MEKIDLKFIVGVAVYKKTGHVRIEIASAGGLVQDMM